MFKKRQVNVASTTILHFTKLDLVRKFYLERLLPHVYPLILPFIIRGFLVRGDQSLLT